MKQKVLHLGRKKLVISITAVSVLMAIASDYIIAVILGHKLILQEDILRAAIIPLLIAPFVSWYLAGLIFEMDKLEKELKKLATFDDLTGVYNRRSFYKICEYLHNYAQFNKKKYCIFIIDLDHFKTINDHYGHAAGDKVLQTFAKTIDGLSRKSDILARIGGEEFVFFLPNTNGSLAKEFAKRLQSIIRVTNVIFEGQSIRFTISIGVCVNPCDGEMSLNEAIRNADKAMYSAKNNGRDQTSFFSSKLG